MGLSLSFFSQNVVQHAAQPLAVAGGQLPQALDHLILLQSGDQRLEHGGFGQSGRLPVLQR